MNPTVRKILVGGLAVAIGVVFGGGVLGYIAGTIDARAPGTISDSVWLPVLFFAFVSVVMGGAIWVAAIWMRTIDEAAQEAHKWAWYWGGTTGMAVGAVIGLMAQLPQAAGVALPSLLPDRTDPAAYMATGAALMALIMTAGYTIAWAVWWLRHR